MFLTFIHAGACISTSFFSLMNNILVCGYTILYLFIHQLMDIWVDFTFLAAVNNATEVGWACFHFSCVGT